MLLRFLMILAPIVNIHDLLTNFDVELTLLPMLYGGVLW